MHDVKETTDGSADHWGNHVGPQVMVQFVRGNITVWGVGLLGLERDISARESWVESN